MDETKQPNDPAAVKTRAAFCEAMHLAWAASMQEDHHLGLLVAGIDRFRAFNASYGYLAGDYLLAEATAVVQEHAEGAIVGRIGGDEFALFWPSISREQFEARAQKLVAQFREKLFYARGGGVHITLSAGGALVRFAEAVPAEELLGRADRAMQKAKRAGRDRLILWPADNIAELAWNKAETAPLAKQSHTSRIKLCEHIMIVDDEPSVLAMLKLILAKSGYAHADAFDSAPKALEAVRQQPGFYGVVITDLSMPDMNGLEFIQALNGLDDSIVKIVVTGFADTDITVNCLREGVYDFILKPFSVGNITMMLKRATEYRRMRIERAKYQAHLEDLVQMRSAQLAQSLEEIRATTQYTLEAMVAMLDAREHQTRLHSQRVRELSGHLAGEMGLRGEEREVVATGALMHDIGKVGLPDCVLLKPGQLTPEEWAVMQRHPEIGYSILKPSGYLQGVAEIVLSHHERYDGEGYPRGLRGDDICLGARIFAVIDSYDAMRSERPYRPTFSPEEAVRELLAHKGTQYDPAVREAFLGCHEQLDVLWRQIGV